MSSVEDETRISSSFRQWCHKELSKILHSSVEDALLDYLLAIEVEKDMREYLQDLLGGESSKQTQEFMLEFFRHWRPPSQASSSIMSHKHQFTDESPALEKVSRPSRDQMALFAKTAEITSEV